MLRRVLTKKINALAMLLDDITMATDRGHITLAIYLDFKKAFDTIDHELLVQKVKLSGVGPKGVALLKLTHCNK